MALQLGYSYLSHYVTRESGQLERMRYGIWQHLRSRAGAPSIRTSQRPVQAEDNLLLRCRERVFEGFRRLG